LSAFFIARIFSSVPFSVQWYSIAYYLLDPPG
jgi:hypothetical protein